MNKHHITWLSVLSVLCLSIAGCETETLRDPSMLRPLPDSGFTATTLFTVGETVKGYQPPGVLDGLAAFPLPNRKLRLLVNHELAPDEGYAYELSNGTLLTGSRISYLDIDTKTKRIIAAGPAFDAIYDRSGALVSDARQVSELPVDDNRGLNALCSARGYRKGEYGFVDDLYFTHEETSAREDHPHGGSVWLLDVQQRELWALPELGRGSWENSAALQTPDMQKPDGHIALLLGDDLEFGGAPLYLWIGRKQPEGNVVERNGLADGRLFVWVPNNGAASPADWRGTGNALDGKFVAIETRVVERAGESGYDQAGYLDDLTLREKSRELGAFQFSRPEDLHTDPANGRRAVFASTGHGKVFPDDDWGALYLIDVSFAGDADAWLTAAAKLTIIFDGDDEGFGDRGIRNPDNLVWSGDGNVYVQEDKATRTHRFGGETGNEVSIWRINPDQPDQFSRIAEIDRSVIAPINASDIKADNIGAWESSGIIDVTEFFPAATGPVLIATVQAHSLRGGSLGDSKDLVQGGQLVLLD